MTSSAPVDLMKVAAGTGRHKIVKHASFTGEYPVAILSDCVAPPELNLARYIKDGTVTDVDSGE
ncbi:hypothetical protein ABZ605_20815 [Streptomyces sp. NPDC012765]|uniref:hypothetical protein n=1 Tax=Streptomyces sp. NPDC012765 TaxID=3155249 RepID=UPI0033FC5393